MVIGLPIRHNWSSPYVERLSWLTDYRRSGDGHEQRPRLRFKPRRQFELNVLTVDQPTLAMLRGLVYRYQLDQLLVPFWPDRTRLLNTAVAGATTIFLDTLKRDFDIGSYLILSSPTDRHRNEFCLIQTVSTGGGGTPSIDLVNPLVNTWPAGNFVAPARRCHINQESVNIRTETDLYENVAMNFNVLVEDQPSYEVGAGPWRLKKWVPEFTYQGDEVFTLQSTNWAEPPDRSLDRTITLLESNTGIFSLRSKEPHFALAWDHRLLLQDRADIAEYLGWLYERRGKQKRFWISSRQMDFQWVSSSGNDLTVKATNYMTIYNLDEGRRHLSILDATGTETRRRIVSVASAGANEIFTLDGSAPANARTISFLYHARLDTDTIEIAYDVEGGGSAVMRLCELIHG